MGKFTNQLSLDTHEQKKKAQARRYGLYMYRVTLWQSAVLDTTVCQEDFFFFFFKKLDK